MTDIQTQTDTQNADESLQTTLDRARITIVIGTLVATTLLYSVKFTSYYHLKVFALALGCALLGLIAVFARRGPTMRVGGLIWVISLLFSIIDIASDLSVRPVLDLPHGDEVFKITLRYLLPFILALSYALLSAETNRQWVSKAIMFAATCASAFAIGQYAGLLNFMFPSYPAASPVYSVFGNPGLLGGYIAVALPLALSMYFRGKFAQPVLLAVMGFMMCALLLSGARSAWLAAAVGSAVVVWKGSELRKTAVVSLVLVAVAIACVLLAPAQTVARASNLFSASDAGLGLRWWFWAGAWEMINDNFIAGVDVGHFALESPRYLADVLWAPGGERFAHNTLLTEHPHNDFLLIWAETGFIGVLFCAWLLTRIARGRGEEWGGLIAWFVFALFNSPLHSPPHALAGFMLAACLVQRTSAPLCEETSGAMWGRRLLGALGLLMLPAVVFFILLPSFRLQRAQQAHIAGQPSLHLYAAADSASGALRAEIDEKYGVALLDAKDYESARNHFKQALKGSDSGSVYLGLGTAEYQLGNKTEAFAALEKAVYRWPSHLNAWRLLMRVCPDSERDSWLVKAKQFLRSSEIKTLEGETESGSSQR